VEVRIGEPCTVEDLSHGLSPDLPKGERYRLLSQRLMERILSL
jgi:hypothetical protein